MTESRTPRPHRPEPMAWGAVESLAGRAQTIAKGWLLLLLERAPLEAAAAIPAAELAAEAPALCNATVRALGSDLELDRLRPHGDLAPLMRRLGPLAGVRDAAGTVAAADALRACVWTASLDAAVDGGDVRALAERLGEVMAVVTATAVEGERADATAERPTAADDGPTAFEAAPTDVGASVTALPERGDGEPATGPGAGMDDGDLWIATLERHLDRCRREGGGLALLRVELLDGERVAASAPDGQAGVPYGRLAQAVRRAIRRQDLVASDHQGRAWVTAPGVGRAGAIALAERIGAGVEEGEAWSGAPLAATIGFAVYGEDGSDAATLIERAEEAVIAATAAGQRIGEAISDPDDGRPGRSGPRLVR